MLTLRTVDGQEFECFVDGIVAKGFSDRLLGLAGHLLLSSHGESVDLRPLHELDDDDADAERELPRNLPPIQPQTFDAKQGVSVQPELTGEEKAALAKLDPDPGALAKPPTLATALPSGDMPAIGVTPARDEATREFLESFAGKPDEYFAGTFARQIARAQLASVDQEHPDVVAIKTQLDKFPDEGLS